MLRNRIHLESHAVTLEVKAVPGARKCEVVGWLGDALKVRVAAAPERGQANEAIYHLLAQSLGINPNQVTIISGFTQTRKRIRISHSNPNLLIEKLEKYK